MATDILFVHPGNHRRNYQELSAEFSAVATPVWSLLLASAVREQGFTVAVYDVNVEGWDQEVARHLLQRYAPRLIVMMVFGHTPTASTQTMPAARWIAGDLKAADPSIPLALGGPHPSALPRRTLAEETADFVIQGEGLTTILGLLQWLDGRQDLPTVKGLWYRTSGEIVSAPPAPLVQDLDREFSSYAWDLLPSLQAYRAHNMHCFQEFHRSRRDDFADVRSPYAVLYTSLGCPYTCHYCSSNAFFGGAGIRYWSIDRVVSWIDELVMRHGVRTIRLDDELFLLDPRRVEAFCDALIDRGYGLNLWVYGRVDTITPSLLSKMKRAGIAWICLGIESGNELVRRNANKNISADIREVVTAIQNHGMYVLANYMFGLPDDTLETMQETLQLATELRTEFANFNSVMAYPGSRLYEQAEKETGVLPDDWEAFSQHGCRTRPLPTRHLSARQVLRFRDHAFVAYHSAPAYRDMVERKFGNRVVSHLDKMLSIHVKRQLLEED